jgi:hypothetical protein
MGTLGNERSRYIETLIYIFKRGDEVRKFRGTFTKLWRRLAFKYLLERPHFCLLKFDFM